MRKLFLEFHVAEPKDLNNCDRIIKILKILKPELKSSLKKIYVTEVQNE